MSKRARLIFQNVGSCLQWAMMAMALGCPVLVMGQSPLAQQGTSSAPNNETTKEYNQKLEQLVRSIGNAGNSDVGNYKIGTDDLLEVSVFEAPDLNRTARVSADGNISLPLLGSVRAAGLTPSELERALEELLRRSYMKDPHVGVFLKEVQSHPISVFGAVKKPGVFQVRGSKSLVEVLSMAEGLAEDAGDTVIIMRPAGVSAGVAKDEQSLANANSSGEHRHLDAASSSSNNASVPAEGATEVSLKNVLESGDSRYNVLVNPGDVVKVTRAGVVYVVGEVKKPGGFMLKTNENISVLQALALAEGLTRTSAKSRARVIRSDEATGARTEIPINLSRILGGKDADPQLRPRDIVFVPNSTGRSAFYRGSEAAISIAGGVIIYRR